MPSNVWQLLQNIDKSNRKPTGYIGNYLKGSSVFQPLYSEELSLEACSTESIVELSYPAKAVQDTSSQ